MAVDHTPTSYSDFVGTTPVGSPNKPKLFQEFIDDGTVPTPVGNSDSMKTDVDDAVAPGGTPTAAQQDLIVTFPSTLSGAEATAYDAVIAAHDGVADPDASPATSRLFTRTGEPGDDDDDTFGTGQSPRDGFRIGDEWLNDADNTIYRTPDNSTGAAVWELTTAFGSARASQIPTLISAFDQDSPPDDNTLMLLDGAGDVFFETRDLQSFANDPLSSITSSTFVNRIDQSPTVIGGDYLIVAYAEIGGANPEVQLLIDSVIEGFQSGAGTFAPHKVITLTAAAHQFELQWRKVSGGGTADITRARILIQKVKN